MDIWFAYYTSVQTIYLGSEKDEKKGHMKGEEDDYKNKRKHFILLHPHSPASQPILSEPLN